MPFYFAQEQFYKRVAKTFLYNPASFRQTQLVATGFRNMGVLHKDDRGNDYFFIPVVGQVVQEFIAQAIKLRTGIDPVLPIPISFTGEVRMATPGLERLGVPSVAPWVGVLVGALGKRFPELEPIQEGIEGEHPNRSPWEMFVPSTVARVYHAFADDPDKSAQMMSAEIQAMQYLEAHGLGPDPDATDADEEFEIWQERVTQWTRTIMLTRAVVGFASPAAPTLDLGEVPKLHKEFITLIGELGYNQGFDEFVRRHPDATPFTVFPTKSVSGGPLPVTKAAFAYMEKHHDLFDDLPRAAGWLLPVAPSKKDEYSVDAYREQLALELRRRLPTRKDIWRQIKFAQAKDEYFTVRNQKDEALAAAQTPERRASIRKIWKDWTTEYKAVHKVFADELDNPEGVQRRQNVLTDLRRAIADPRYPTDKQASHLRDMVNVYDDYRAHADAIKASPHPGTKRNKALADRYKSIFIGWAETYIEENPDVDTFYRMIVQPDVDPDADREI
jgi:hypothetical protein